MPHTEAKKPVEGQGIRKDIERQQKKMTELFNELKEVVKKPDWDDNPKKFLEELGKKIKSLGIDEDKLVDFIYKEVETPFRLTFRRAMSVWMEEFDTSEFPIKPNEKRKLGVDARFGLAEEEGKIGKELVTIAECIKDAGRKKLGIVDFFGKMSESEAKQVVKNNRDIGEAAIQYWKDEEREKAYS